MKRINQDVAGRPKLTSARREAAGVGIASNWASGTSFRRALRQCLDDPAAVFAGDAMLLEDFSDFIFAEERDPQGSEQGVRSSEADPEFRERLRGRLWRTYVQTHLRDPGGRH